MEITPFRGAKVMAGNGAPAFPVTDTATVASPSEISRAQRSAWAGSLLWLQRKVTSACSVTVASMGVTSSHSGMVPSSGATVNRNSPLPPLATSSFTWVQPGKAKSSTAITMGEP